MNSSDTKTPSSARIAAAATFLSLLFQSEDWITLRLVQTWDEDGKKKSKVAGNYCHTLKDLTVRDGLMLDLILNHADREQANLFFGVNPRPFWSGSPWRPEGSFDFAGHVGVVRNLYCDLDKTSPEKAATIKPTPSIVLASGHASHVYWRLAESVQVRHSLLPVFKKKGPMGVVKFHAEGTGEPKPSPEADHVSKVLVGLSAALDGDHCTDLARLLRLPGSMNYKGFKNGREPKPVNVVAVNDVTYTFAEFEKYALSVPSTPKKTTVKPGKTVPSSGDRITKPLATDLRPLEGAIRACEDAPVGTRSERDYALVCEAVSLGLDPNAVWEAVSGISKFAERSRAGYFDKTWEKADSKRQMDEEEFAELDAAFEAPAAPARSLPQVPATPLTTAEDDRVDPRFAYLWRGQHGKRLTDPQRAARIRSLREVYDLTPLAVHAYLDWASPATDAPPIFHLGGFLAIASTLLNRRVWLDIGGHKTRPQLWVANIAESSVHRKSTAANFATSWLRKDEVYGRTILSSAAFSMEGVYSELGIELGGVGLHLALENCRSEEAKAEVVGDPFTRGIGLFTPDEMGSWLATLDASYNRGAKKIVTEWYDFAGDYFHKTLAKGNGYFIYRPFVNVIASSTIDWINAHAQEEDLMGGFFPRWLFLCNHHADYRLSIRDAHGPTQPVEAALDRLKTAKGAFTLTPEAEDLFAGWDQRFVQVDDVRLTAWVNRLSVMAQKVALIFAASEGDGLVEARHMVLATGLIDRTLADLRRLLRTDLAFTEDEKHRNKVIRVLEAKGVVPHAVLLRTTRLPARELRDILQTLEEQEMIVTEEVRTATKEGKVYRLVG